MTNNFVTEISEEDFKKLNLVGYDHKRVEYDTYNKIKFVPKFLNEVIDENKNFCKENGWSTIAIAIHTEPTEEEIQKARDISLNSMTEKAESLGANAIIGLKISYDNLGGTMGNTILVTAYGTAIKYE